MGYVWGVLHTGGVQSMLVQKLQDLAMHEVEGERLTRALIRLAASCRVNSKKVRRVAMVAHQRPAEADWCPPTCAFLPA